MISGVCLMDGKNNIYAMSRFYEGWALDAILEVPRCYAMGALERAELKYYLYFAANCR